MNDSILLTGTVHDYMYMKHIFFFFPALSAKEGSHSSNDILGQASSDNNKASTPTKLSKLRYSGYSAEFLDRVEPNGNIPHKNIQGNEIYSIFNKTIK